MAEQSLPTNGFAGRPPDSVAPIRVNPWLLCFRRKAPARLRLFCFPFAGAASGAVFRSWPSGLAREVEVLAVELPGRGSRLKEPPRTRLSQLVVELAEVLHPHLTMPFAFFGHSLGALTCFELVRQLRRTGSPVPVHLFVSGWRAPELPPRNPPVHQLADTLFLREVQRRYTGIPEAVLAAPDLLQLILPSLKADFMLIETYEHRSEEPLGVPISCFGGTQDASVTMQELEAWKRQTAGRFALRMFHGGHFFIQDAQSAVLQAVSERLSEILVPLRETGADAVC